MSGTFQATKYCRHWICYVKAWSDRPEVEVTHAGPCYVEGWRTMKASQEKVAIVQVHQARTMGMEVVPEARPSNA